MQGDHHSVRGGWMESSRRRSLLKFFILNFLFISSVFLVCLEKHICLWVVFCSQVLLVLYSKSWLAWCWTVFSYKKNGDVGLHDTTILLLLIGGSFQHIRVKPSRILGGYQRQKSQKFLQKNKMSSHQVGIDVIIIATSSH